MMQFRNNAVYAVAVFMLLLLILRPKKEKLGILILGICLVLGAVSYTHLDVYKRQMLY